MTGKTKWLILLTMIAWTAFDIWLDSAGHQTASQIIIGISGYFGVPIIFGVGFVCGHVFWGQSI